MMVGIRSDRVGERGLRGAAPLASILLATALLSADALAGQAFQGRVLEEGEGFPVEEVWVELLDLQGRSLRRTLTDEEGGWRLDAPAAGSYRLRFSRIGYQPLVTDTLEVEEGEVARVFVSLSLRPIVLDSLVVAGRRRPPGSASGQEKFSFRAGEGLGGVFLTRVHILDRRPRLMSDMIRGVEGFMLTGTGELRSLRGQGCLVVFLNDFPIREMHLDEIPPEQVMGIEVYREFREIPPDLRIHADQCGAINVWMRGAW